jgi:hypothetical protein
MSAWDAFGVSAIVTTAIMVVHHFLLDWILLVTWIFAMLLVGVWHAIHEANKSKAVGPLVLAIGLGLYYFKVPLGVNIFSWSLDKYVYDLLIIGGAIAVYRRFFNWFIWKKLDAIAIRHNLVKQEGDAQEEVEEQTDFEQCYKELSQAIVNHLKINDYSKDYICSLEDTLKSPNKINESVALLHNVAAKGE